jgi:hypothetical protein
VHLPSPRSEPFVDEGFPDSEYDADPDFSRRRDLDDDDEGDDRDEGQGNQPSGDLVGVRGTTTADDWVAGDVADAERSADELRRRLDTAQSGDRTDPRPGGERDRARSFAEGAARIAGAHSGASAGEVGPARIGGLIAGALDAIGEVPDTDPYGAQFSAIPRNVTTLRNQDIAITFHARFDEGDEVFRMIRLMQNQPVVLKIRLDKSKS